MMTTQPRIACICPTYKRPLALANAIACFMQQDYSPNNRRLFVLDDAKQYPGTVNDDYTLVSERVRYAHLPAKYNRLIQMASKWRPDIIAIWEDDDVYLRHHLSQIADAFRRGRHFITPAHVWSTYSEPIGKAHQEEAPGRFHASWAMTKALIDHVRGYQMTDELIFDQRMWGIFRDADPGHTAYTAFYPSYVYRWGRFSYNGSQSGDQGYLDFWKSLEGMEAPFVVDLVPQMDEETALLYNTLDGRYRGEDWPRPTTTSTSSTSTTTTFDDPRRGRRKSKSAETSSTTPDMGPPIPSV